MTPQCLEEIPQLLLDALAGTILFSDSLLQTDFFDQATEEIRTEPKKNHCATRLAPRRAKSFPSTRSTSPWRR